MAEKQDVDAGLWSFCVDNFPVGMVLRNHPMDSLQNESTIVLKDDIVLRPMTKVYCDRKVAGQNGAFFYRVQGSQPTKWVFDTRSSSGKPTFMMVPENTIRRGLFAFRALHPVAIRLTTYVGDENKSFLSIAANEIVACDLIRNSPWGNTNGPFLRLADGTGWLFVKKYSKTIMEQVAIEEGLWHLQVKHRMQLRKQPIDDTTSRFSKIIFQVGEEITCDRKITTSSTSFYRVQNTIGWVFDRRGTTTMAEVISSNRINNQQANGAGWKVEFVRGVAAAIDNMEEIDYNPQSRVISFRHQDGARVNVYYTTRTIGTALDHPSQGKTQLFRRQCTNEELVIILKNPRVHTGHGYQRTHKRGHFEYDYDDDDDDDVNLEEELRNRLVELDEGIFNLGTERQALVNSLHVHEKQRDWDEAEVNKRFDEHRKALRAAAKQMELATRTCKHCGREFATKAAMETHVNAVHVTYRCNCGREFKNKNSFHQHANATGHY